jgi:hypothetical protein
LATVYGTRKVGSIFSAGGITYDSRYDANYAMKSDNKTSAGKRPRPRGIGILFDGTTVYSNKVRYDGGTYTESYSSPPDVFSSSTQFVPVPQIGPSPGLMVPDKYWANELRNAVRDTDINLAQAFAERKQTVNMFVDYGGRILKSYRSLRRGDANGVFNALLGVGKRPYKGWKSTIRDATGVASDSWLAWQYGVRPLISDLKGAVSEYYKVRGVSPIVRSYSRSASTGERLGGTVTHAYGSYTTSWNQNASIRCHAQFEDSASAWDQSAARLGLTDPLLLAWELIPYSFVVDWFVNVGSFLQAAGTFQGLSRVGVSITTTTREESVGSYMGGTGTRVTTDKYREFRSSMPMPQIRINSNPLSLSHTTSALALIRQLWK